MDKDELTIEQFAKYRLERAKQDLSDAEFSYKNNRFLNANNRAYYSIFHAIRAVLALEQKDFKRHKDVLAYFNQYYIIRHLLCIMILQGIHYNKAHMSQYFHFVFHLVSRHFSFHSRGLATPSFFD